jgi:ribosomal protein S18 acetylase RimI-like enzyme
VSDALLDKVDAYLDAVPRPATRPEDIGGLVLFVPATDAGWRYYARPRRGAAGPTEEDVRRTRARQRELRLPEELEWVVEVTPGLGAAAAAARLRIEESPLMVLDDRSALAARRDVDAQVRLVTSGDDLALIGAVPAVAFAHAGTAAGEAGADALRAAAAGRPGSRVAFERDRVRSGATVMAAAFVDGLPVAYGAHQPLGDATELVGIATLPAFRRRGLGAAVTAFLAADAVQRGVGTIFLSAAEPDVARLYGSIGFRRVGTAGAASPR